VQPATRSGRFLCDWLRCRWASLSESEIRLVVQNPEKGNLPLGKGAKPTGPACRPVPRADSRAAEGFGRSGFLFDAVVRES
jgi:hypothetical protein